MRASPVDRSCIRGPVRRSRAGRRRQASARLSLYAASTSAASRRPARPRLPRQTRTSSLDTPDTSPREPRGLTSSIAILHSRSSRSAHASHEQKRAACLPDVASSATTGGLPHRGEHLTPQVQPLRPHRACLAVDDSSLLPTTPRAVSARVRHE